MTGFVGFIGAKKLLEQSSDSFELVSGVEVNTWQEPNCQFMLKTPRLHVAHHSFSNEQVRVDVFGDIFSSKVVNHECKDEDATWSEIIADVYSKGELDEFLSTLNGYFTLAIYDKLNESLTLVTDRFGHRPLYVWQSVTNSSNKILGFASEIKALLLHPEHEVLCDKSKAKMFVEVGHMLGQDTLFANIDRIAPATKIIIDCSSQEYTQKQYWQWSDIKKNKAISFEQATDDLYFYFEQAMKRCLNSISQNNLSVTLSGGLDSRVLLASAKNNFSGNINTFTFGQKGCDDIEIAAQVCQVADVSNTVVNIEQENWFDGREEGVWLTDGLKNILHMHTLSSLDKISHDSNYLLNGYIGDVVLGGSYLYADIGDLSTSGARITQSYQPYAEISGKDEKYCQFEGTDPYLIYNRGVRFVSAGSDLLSHKVNNLKPFVDNDLIEFAYSLPDSYRQDSKLYKAMLLKYYPDYFVSIPWQKTGKPISLADKGDDEVTKISTALLVKRFLIEKIKGSPFDNVARKIYRKLSAKHSYAVYDDWLRLPEFQQYVEAMLLSEDSYTGKLLSPEYVVKMVTDYFKGSTSVNVNSIGCLLTIEVYLRKLSTVKNINL